MKMIDDEVPSRRSVMKAMALGLGASYAPAASSAPAPDPRPAGDIFVTQYGAHGDGSTDDTIAFEQAILAAAQSGRRLRIPAGRYRITRTLEINRGVLIEGDGVERTVLLGALGRSRPMLHVHAKETDSIIGFHLSGLKLICDQGADPSDGVRLSTGGKGAAIQQAVMRDLFIINVGTGISLSGVVYRSCFDNITVSGKVIKYGVYCDRNFEDVTYNSFSNFEVTNVSSNAHAYWIHSNYSNFLNLTSDGCCYFSSPGGALRNLSVEGISAAIAGSDTVVQLNQMQVVDGVNLIGIDPRKCSYGIKVIGQATTIRAIRCMAQQPVHVLDLDPNSEGVIIGVQTERTATMLENYLPAATLNRWIFQGAEAITRRQLVYAEGDWGPTFEDWITAPVVEAATWERMGRRVFLSLSATGGKPGRNATITGLPILIGQIGALPLTGVAAQRQSLFATVTRDGRAILMPAGSELAGEWGMEISFRMR